MKESEPAQDMPRLSSYLRGTEGRNKRQEEKGGGGGGRDIFFSLEGQRAASGEKGDR